MWLFDFYAHACDVHPELYDHEAALGSGNFQMGLDTDINEF